MTKVTITDNQRTVLQAAANSANLIAWPVPQKLGLNSGSSTIVVKGLLKKGLLEERHALGDDATWREDDDGRKLTVVITKSGMAAIGMLSLDEARQEPDTGDAAHSDAAESTNTPAVTANLDQPRMPRAGSKLAILVALLSREEGATVEEMVGATGWQTHSVRGIMSGALVKKFGLRIVSEKVEGRGRVYRVAGDPAEPGEDDLPVLHEMR